MDKAEAWVMIPILNKDKTGCDLNLYPLVMCKDCKYHDEKDGKNFCDCGNRPDDWFCADGKRKE